MGTLFVRCPTTGKDIASGIEIDHLSFELTPAFTGTIHCPICGVEHRWSKIDAWISDTQTLALSSADPAGPSPPLPTER